MSMLPRKARVEFSEPAEQDYIDILDETELEWGWDQRQTYDRAFNSAFDRLAHFPESGRKRDDLTKDLRFIRCQEHLISYRFDRGLVLVSRILHVHQDLVEIDFIGPLTGQD